ncbi:MAG: zincin-like metallopeptidase domain-containing protein [Ramlibacter sp.]
MDSVADSEHGQAALAPVPAAQLERPRQDLRSEVTQKLIEAMEAGNTPWQRPWSAQSLQPRNGVTHNLYRGINRLLLSLAGQEFADSRWVTFAQAAANGWNVKRGAKGQMVVKLLDFGEGRGASEQAGAEKARDQTHSSQSDAGAGGKRFGLKRYWVFNAEQVEGMPSLAAQPGQPDFDPVQRAENVMQALKEKTGLLIMHGARNACYVPAKDEVRLPHKKFFRSPYEYYATALHECGHSTLSEKRLDRRDALGKRFGDAAYSMEELRAELCSAYLAAETGVAHHAGQDTEAAERHLGNHAAYIKSWIEVLKKDPLAIFAAAKDADLMATYLLDLERDWSAMKVHKEWVAAFEGRGMAIAR